jgi:hypothetical protein
MVLASRTDEEEAEFHADQWEQNKELWVYAKPEFVGSWWSVALKRVRGQGVATQYYRRRLTGNFGARFTLMMASVYFGVKGILYNLVDLAMLPYFSTMLKVSSERYQSYMVVILTPWSIKSLMGECMLCCTAF